MSIESEIAALEPKVQQGLNDHNRAQGVYDSVITRNKADHGVDTLAEADALKAKYEDEAKGHEAKAQGALDECRKLVEGAI